MSNLNWAKLYKQGRCKIPGVPWSNPELKARYEFKIPAEYVRKGILTLEDYDKARKEGAEDSPLLSIDESKEKLMKRAKELGIDATSDVREDDLIRLIEEAQKKIEKESKEDSEDSLKEEDLEKSEDDSEEK